MKWSIRILVFLEFLTLLSILFDEVREIAFPDGTTALQALIVFLLLLVLEELYEIRQLFQEL